jgi:serine/threonine-protein kinase
MRTPASKKSGEVTQGHAVDDVSAPVSRGGDDHARDQDSERVGIAATHAHTEVEESLIEIALQVSDDAPIDWDTAGTLHPDLTDTLRELRAIAAVAHEHHRTDADEQIDDEKERPRLTWESHAAPLFTWGPLRVLGKLGEGGFGEVWRAWDPALQREVALKLRRAGARGRGAERWLDEARRLARVRHPNVLTVHGADLHDGCAGIWTDLLRGRTLEDLLTDIGPLGAREAALIGLDLCAALSAVHAAGLVHGDVKTKNVMREGDLESRSAAGRIVLMDFGSTRDNTVDADDTTAGTPLYTAPEVLVGAGRPTRAADIYSLGVLLYRLVTGSAPVEARSLEELCAKHARGEHRSLRAVRPDLPPAFIHAVERALERDPAKRFSDTAEMERALAHVLGVGAAVLAPRRARRGMLAAVFCVGAIAGGLALWVMLQWHVWFRPMLRVKPAHLATRTLGLVRGQQLTGWLGYAVASGDINGDSLLDLVVSAPGEDGGRGAVYVYLGRHAAPPSLALRLVGRTGEGFGYALASGDMNGDGYADFAIAANLSDVDATDAGRVYVWFGGSRLHETPDLVLPGRGLGQDFGYSLSLSGDMNGDGYSDLAVGAPLDGQAGQITGRVYVFFGGPHVDAEPDLDLTSASAQSQYGLAVTWGDVNGDGFGDLVVGANWDNTDGPVAGRVYVYYGSRRPDVLPDLTLRGPEPRGLFGNSVSAGDLNGDGYADLAICQVAHGGLTGGSGEVNIYFGGPRPDAQVDLRLPGTYEVDTFGEFAWIVNDLDGDGVKDLVVGAYTSDKVAQNAGACYVFLGGPHMDAVADVELLGETAWSSFGKVAASLGDVDGDGFGDLAVAASWMDDAARRSGRLYLFDFDRYTIARPQRGDLWHAGSDVTVSWLGAERADIWLSPDGGHHYTRAAHNVGGREENAARIHVPESATGVFLRLAPARRNARGAALVGPIRITR